MDRDSEREAGKYRGPFIAEPFQDHSWSLGAQWLSGRVLDFRPRGRRFRRHCVVFLSLA